MFAHIAGIPVEETALSFAPVAVAAGGVASARLRQRAAGRRRVRSASPATAQRKVVGVPPPKTFQGRPQTGRPE
jgi:hypothetical protein